MQMRRSAWCPCGECPPREKRFQEEYTAMSDIKKDHSIGEGTGAGAGAITGAALGSMAGPVGTVAGAVVGAVAGAKAGGALAEAVNPTEYTGHFRKTYEHAP